MTAGESIRELALPVVMISANGLICLALYNRLAAITSRFRAICREQFDVETRLLEMEDGSPRDLVQQYKDRLLLLTRQRRSARARARQIRDALLLLLLAVIVMFATSLLLGLSQELALSPVVPLGAFVAGVGLMIAGVGLAIRELYLFLEVMEPEEGELDSLDVVRSEGTPQELTPLLERP
jgi:hypothetical protein